MEKSKPYPNITYAMQFCDTYLMHAQRYSQQLTHFNQLNPHNNRMRWGPLYELCI